MKESQPLFNKITLVTDSGRAIALYFAQNSKDVPEWPFRLRVLTLMRYTTNGGGLTFRTRGMPLRAR
ncbi:MAG: hypothetical protein PVJ21_01215 [Anaerolineales bacterium]|jgi:hypothetical protein